MTTGHAHADTLIGLAIIIVGIALRLNLTLVIVSSAVATAMLDGRTLHDSISLLGHFFVSNRYLSILFAVLPMVGLLERRGLAEASRSVATRVHLNTPGSVLRVYFFIRQITVALGLTSFGGHPQMVRPVIIPMVENATEQMTGAPPTPAMSNWLRAQAAAIDNVASFFGEDIFVAFVSILFMQATLATFGIHISPWHLSCWALPTAVMAAVITCVRTTRMDRTLRRQGQGRPTA